MSLSHEKLISIGFKWLKRRCSIVFCEFATAANETPDLIGWRSAFSTLIECKASRADFLKDKKKITRRYPIFGMGQHRYYLCESDIINVDDLPKHWGLLWVKNNRIRIKQTPDPHPNWDKLSEIKFLVSMLRRAQIRIAPIYLAIWLRKEFKKGNHKQ